MFNICLVCDLENLPVSVMWLFLPFPICQKLLKLDFLWCCCFTFSSTSHHSWNVPSTGKSSLHISHVNLSPTEETLGPFSMQHWLIWLWDHECMIKMHTWTPIFNPNNIMMASVQVGKSVDIKFNWASLGFAPRPFTYPKKMVLSIKILLLV